MKIFFLLSAAIDLLIPEPIKPDEWITLVDVGIQVWFSQWSMVYGDAITYCNTMNGTLFEPYNQAMFETVTNAARRAGIERIWLGLTDVLNEGM